jgi:predicted chitinase
MIISPPFLPATGLTSGDPSETDPMMALVESFELSHHGVYPIAFDRRWHCGTHLAPPEQTEPVRAIADGEVIAYRYSKQAITDGQIDPYAGSPALNSNTGFVLLKHVTDTGDGRAITFYSLYMHLLDMANQQSIAHQPTNPTDKSSPTGLPAWLLDLPGGKDGAVQSGDGRKVWRKDMLGYWGGSHGKPHLHFEIFMTEADFTAWFEQAGHEVQIGGKKPVTPTSKDYWGRSYFVIPGGQAFVGAPYGQRDSAYFPAQTAGTLDQNSTLYVEAYFHKGERYTRSWIDRGDGKTVLLTALPVKDPCDGYEYNLYQRAVDLYPDCPGDGYELLRFGRILGTDAPTLPASARSTWVAVPFDENGTMGYIDISQDAIQKLSDADFPFFTGWQKIDDIDRPLDAAGLWHYAELRKLVGDAPASQSSANQSGPPFSLNDELTGYVRGSDAVRARLKGFVCHAPSEWDAGNNDQRYKGLNEPDGFFGSRADTDPDGYKKFLGFLKKFQFLEQTPLGGGQKFWFFHPLAFIRHFRKCGWLSESELAQCIPRQMLSLNRTQFVSTTHPWSMALKQGRAWKRELNLAMSKYLISSAGQRLTHFLAQLMEESGWLQLVREVNGEARPYNPYFGRGLIQLTKAPNYEKYGSFKKFPVDSAVPAQFYEIKWNPNVLLAESNSVFNRENCADSAGLYWTCRAMTAIGVNSLATSDSGIDLAQAIQASKSTNGNVTNEKLNGLEHRLQSFIYIKYIILDKIENGSTESISFVWRRNSSQEPVLNADGTPALDSHTHNPKKKFYPTNQNISVSLEKQRP